MGGGLMQLVANGVQDTYLTSNPQMTFFKAVYKRHTNFSIESIEQEFDGSNKLGDKFSCVIARNGDLLSQVYLEINIRLSHRVEDIEQITIRENIGDGGSDVITTVIKDTVTPRVLLSPANELVVNDAGTNNINIVDVSGNSYVNKQAANGQTRIPPGNELRLTNEIGSRRLGLRVIKSVEVQIGGLCIDKHYGDWMDIWSNLSSNEQKRHKHNRLVNATLHTGSSGERKIYIPLQFWFCTNPGLALPLIALQYHEVKLNFEFNPKVEYQHNTNIITGAKLDGVGLIIGSNNFTTAANVDIMTINTVTVSVTDCRIFCDYIFLDTNERRRFAKMSHEYLIEQLQYSNTLNISEGVNKFGLKFNHPVKEIIWVPQTSYNSGRNFYYWGDVSGGIGTSVNHLTGTTMLVKPLIITKSIILLNGHERLPERDGSYFRSVQPYQHHSGGVQDMARELGGYCVYCFAIKPEEHQPSGTCNFSRIDNPKLHLTSQYDGTVKIYATNYNVLRIMGGMGGVMYSN